MFKEYNENGTVVYTETKTQPSLKKCQEIVGGYIEIMSLADGSQLIMDEEGKLKPKPINEIATKLISETTQGWRGDHVIVGDVIILKGKAKLD